MFWELRGLGLWGDGGLLEQTGSWIGGEKDDSYKCFLLGGQRSGLVRPREVGGWDWHGAVHRDFPQTD